MVTAVELFLPWHDSDVDKSTCNACGRRDLCRKCLTAHNCEVLIDEIDHKFSGKAHLTGVECITSEEIGKMWKLHKDGKILELPLCRRCEQHMNVDDDGEMFCKACRLSEAEKAGLVQTCALIRTNLENLTNTEFFTGDRHLTFCVCCCDVVENIVMVICDMKSQCQSPYRVL